MASTSNGAVPNGHAAIDTSHRSNSISQASESSQTAQEYVFSRPVSALAYLIIAHSYIRSQLQLEQDAREALPYVSDLTTAHALSQPAYHFTQQFDTCTKPLGPLRQTVFSCLTCNPPPSEPSAAYSPAGVCYSCSISCHGEHELVELFARRQFECDCGTTRLPSSSSCSLRLNQATGLKGGIKSETPAPGNTYNHNYRNRFCGCGETYDPHTEKGTMFQCLGLASEADGGCGEDWWHPECLLGLPREVDAPAETAVVKEPQDANNVSKKEREDEEDAIEGRDEEPPLPPGFPDEDSFEHLICYKCADAVPWIKAYAGAPGFLPAALHASSAGPELASPETIKTEDQPTETASVSTTINPADYRKRKVDDQYSAEVEIAPPPKKQNMDSDSATSTAPATSTEPVCTYPTPPPSASFKASLFLTEDFRSLLCRCPKHFPMLSPLPFLLEEEETYEPPVSEGSEAGGDGTRGSEGSRSIYDRGEAALSAVDRVRAIEGVMAYNHLRDKVKGFLKPFAESRTPVGAEDVKAYFEKLRGDDLAMKQAQAGQSADSDGANGNGEGDGRKEQGGY